MTDDPRIPVVVGRVERAAPHDRVLHPPTGSAMPGHGFACACCRPRGALAAALGRLFLDRARDPAQDFRRVLVVGDDAEAVAAAIEDDVLARARFRFAGRA